MTVTPSAVEPAEPVPSTRGRGRRWPRRVLLGLATAHVVAIFAQPTLAGMLLVGHYDALSWHAVGADVVFYLGLAQLVAALLVWARGGPRWPAAVAALIAAGETGQYFAGLAGALDLHVPLGVALVATTVVFVVALWRPGTVGAHAAAR